MMNLLTVEEAQSLFPKLKKVELEELEAAITRASIFIQSQTELPFPIPEDVKLAVATMVTLEKDGPAVKEISRSDYREVYDTSNRQWMIVELVLSKYQPKPKADEEKNGVYFL
ncbi:hypothetical protein [Bacillus sp. CGMCC 1.16541]|uniref:hypothetical protein n=1 Tax=Bacillus sp. CGMCC 1.16541 TaxID=2185143 RepID=UPI000D733E8D|nr:hypothetical protein [Bacillus sp. CGMCC 1.16541]